MLVLPMRNEGARRSAFSFFDGEVIAEDPGSVGEGVTVSLRREHLFTRRAFTSLKVNQAIVKAFDGVRVLEPWVVYLKPMHGNPELSVVLMKRTATSKSFVAVHATATAGVRRLTTVASRWATEG